MEKMTQRKIRCGHVHTKGQIGFQAEHQPSGREVQKAQGAVTEDPSLPWPLPLADLPLAVLTQGHQAAP